MSEKNGKILVLGGTGAMGVYLVPELLRLGYKVDVVSLDDIKSDNPSLTYTVGNAKNEAFIKPILERGYDGIVDFMLYSTALFESRYRLLLGHTAHYIYLSSYRVYADEEHPITESSPRLLNVSTDAEMLSTDTYALAKAKQEDILAASGYKNYTVVRPAITYSKLRYQLVTLEASVIVNRAMHGKKVLLPEEALDAMATMTWAGDVAKMISRLLFNEKAFCGCFTVSTSEHNSWRTIAGYYRDIIGLETVAVPERDYLALIDPEKPERDARWQLEYDRMFDRIVDNSKVLAVTGLRQSDFSSLRDGLGRELAALPRDTVWKNDTELNARMDRYIAAHNL